MYSKAGREVLFASVCLHISNFGHPRKARRNFEGPRHQKCGFQCARDATGPLAWRKHVRSTSPGCSEVPNPPRPERPQSDPPSQERGRVSLSFALSACPGRCPGLRNPRRFGADARGCGWSHGSGIAPCAAVQARCALNSCFRTPEGQTDRRPKVRNRFGP